jgi:hypothetical protein
MGFSRLLGFAASLSRCAARHGGSLRAWPPGVIAITLIALAALAGAGLLAARILKRRINGGMIGIHATLAVSGFVVLAAYAFAG